MITDGKEEKCQTTRRKQQKEHKKKRTRHKVCPHIIFPHNGLEGKSHAKLQLVEILVVREVNILQIGVLVFTHHLDVLVERIVQTNRHSVRLATVHAGPTRIVHDFCHSVPVAVRIELIVAVDETVALGDVGKIKIGVTGHDFQAVFVAHAFQKPVFLVIGVGSAANQITQLDVTAIQQGWTQLVTALPARQGLPALLSAKVLLEKALVVAVFPYTGPNILGTSEEPVGTIQHFRRDRERIARPRQIKIKECHILVHVALHVGGIVHTGLQHAFGVFRTAAEVLVTGGDTDLQRAVQLVNGLVQPTTADAHSLIALFLLVVLELGENTLVEEETLVEEPVSGTQRTPRSQRLHGERTGKEVVVVSAGHGAHGRRLVVVTHFHAMHAVFRSLERVLGEEVLLAELALAEAEIGIEVEFTVGQCRMDTGVGDGSPGLHRRPVGMVISEVRVHTSANAGFHGLILADVFQQRIHIFLRFHCRG